ncbi:MAG TPA: GNAT family N-acetyltransferase [bacterium]|nr:GNAT family N-acetyltransferase [bacterium]HPJ71109.1 GNAT family N-acetyltransferase [bacterium]
MPSIRQYDSPNVFSDLGGIWNKLVVDSPLPSIFLTREWLTTWWRIFGESHRLSILVFREGSDIVGIAPLYIRRRAISPLLNIREVLPVGAGATVRSEDMDIIAAKNSYSSCVESTLAFWEGRNDWHSMILTDARRRLLFSLLSSSTSLPIQVLSESLCYRINVPASFDDYLDGLDRKKRRALLYRRRRLEREFTVEYHRLETPDEVPSWLKIFESLHTWRWRQKGQPGKFANPGYREFHQEISRRFFEKKWLFARDLKLNGKTVAAAYCFLFNNTLYFYQTGFDPRLGQYEVMKALIAMIIEECIGKRIATFDFLAAAEDYKRRFSNEFRKITSVRIINRRPAGRLYGRAQSLREIWA